jgi:hypothetical protein
MAFSPAAQPANLLPSPNRQPRQSPRVRPTSHFPAANPAQAPWPSTLASFPGLLQLAPQAQQLARAPAYPASAHTPISPTPRDDAPQVHPPASPNARADATPPLLAWPHRSASHPASRCERQRQRPFTWARTTARLHAPRSPSALARPRPTSLAATLGPHASPFFPARAAPATITPRSPANSPSRARTPRPWLSL